MSNNVMGLRTENGGQMRSWVDANYNDTINAETRKAKRQLYYFENYFRTIPAFIRIAQLLLLFTAFVISCLERRFLVLGGSWLVLVTLASLSCSCFFVAFHFLMLHDKLPGPWSLLEFLCDVVVSILIFSGGVLSAAYSYIGPLIITETVLMFLALAFYMIDGLFSFKLFQAGRYYE